MITKTKYLIIVSDITQSTGTLNLAPGVPLPNADVLYRIIMTKVFQSSSNVDGSHVIDFLLGKTKPHDPDIPRVNVLDYPTLRKIIKLAKLRHMNTTFEIAKQQYYKKNKLLLDHLNWERFRVMNLTNKLKFNNTRRWNHADDVYWRWYRTQTALNYRYDWGPEYELHLRLHSSVEFSDKFMSLMQQSVYQTQYNLKKTKFYRKKFQPDLNYQFALMYGMILESKDKIDGLLNFMQDLNHDQKWYQPNHMFIYFLSIYEKVLAAATDINYLTHHLNELSRGIREGIIAAQKKAEPKDKLKRAEVRRRHRLIG